MLHSILLFIAMVVVISAPDFVRVALPASAADGPGLKNKVLHRRDRQPCHARFHFFRLNSPFRHDQ